MGERERRRRARLAELQVFERERWAAGISHVAGLDEVGAGPLAGPVVAGCVVLDPDRTDELLGVDDSKKLSARARTELAPRIRAAARAVGLGEASVEEIDALNIRNAALLAMRRALAAVEAQLGRVDHLLIDARALELGIPETALIKGDSRSLSIAAASILAKVERDLQMDGLDRAHPGYGFADHKGYGTRAHFAAIERLGPSPVHRRSFEPVRSMLATPPSAP